MPKLGEAIYKIKSLRNSEKFRLQWKLRKNY